MASQRNVAMFCICLLTADSGCSVVIDKMAEEEQTEEKTPTETVTFKVVFKKQKHQVTLPLDSTTAELKSHLDKLTGITKLNSIC